MALSQSELEQIISLALSALRGQGPGVAPDQAAALAALQAQPAGRTLGEWMDVHAKLLTERGYKPQTIRNRGTNLKHVRRLWGEVVITDLKPHRISADLRSFLPDRTSTSVRVLAELRDVYTEAIANGWAETNPAAHLKPVKHRVQRRRLAFDTWVAMRELSKASPQQWLECLLLLALVTGQRRADLALMRFDHIVKDETGAEYLRIEQQKQAGKGYGARVEIPLALRMDAIGMTVGDVIERCRAAGKPGDTLLRKAGGGAIEMSSLSARFAECIHAVLGADDPGPRTRPSLHEVRSLSARVYHAQGVDVQTLLGHKHAEMTEVYRDDRGLSANEWKRVTVAAPAARAAA